MKLTPNLKVVGTVTEEEKTKVKDALSNVYEHPWPMVEADKVAHVKTPARLSILKFIDDETSRLMQEVGVEPFSIPSDRYFVLDNKDLKRFSGADGAAGVNDGTSPRILLSHEDMVSDLDFARIAFHETLHVKAMHLCEAFKNGDRLTVKIIGHGITVESTHEKDLKGNTYRYFHPLHEATVEWMSELAFPKIMDLPELAEIKKNINSASFKEARQKLAKDLNMNETRILWISPDNKPSMFVYGYPRTLLRYICETISRHMNTEYSTREDVFKEFIKVHFTSDLSKVITLVNDTFGPHAFRILEKLDSENQVESCARALIELEKKRQGI